MAVKYAGAMAYDLLHVEKRNSLVPFAPRRVIQYLVDLLGRIQVVKLLANLAKQ